MAKFLFKDFTGVKKGKLRDILQIMEKQHMVFKTMGGKWVDGFMKYVYEFYLFTNI